jgi:hypothetical protein
MALGQTLGFLDNPLLCLLIWSEHSCVSKYVDFDCCVLIFVSKARGTNRERENWLMILRNLILQAILLLSEQINTLLSRLFCSWIRYILINGTHSNQSLLLANRRCQDDESDNDSKGSISPDDGYERRCAFVGFDFMGLSGLGSERVFVLECSRYARVRCACADHNFQSLSDQSGPCFFRASSAVRARARACACWCRCARPRASSYCLRRLWAGQVTTFRVTVVRVTPCRK